MLDEKIKKRIDFYKRNERDTFFLKDLNELLEKNDEGAIYERFYQDLSFGTAGLRGVVGAGTNMMNTFTVSRATQGIANYLKKTFSNQKEAKELKAVIAYDSRCNSYLFAKTAALIFAGNGITCYLFSSMRATPELSFAIKTLKCNTGIVITASHNPREYNGYKAYWSDGVQITAPHDENITKEVENVEKIISIEEDEALNNGLLKMIDKEIDEPYLSSLLKMTGELREKSNLKIVYTPLHGVGAVFVEKVLKDSGFDLFTVPEQREGDGSFPTVEYPNPEDAKALSLALEYAKKMGADIVMATDPDADRFAAGVKDEKGDIKLLTGNQIGVLFFDYLCKTSLKNIKNAAIIRSIVSTHMVDKIAQSHNIKTFQCLTGFKWICGLKEKLEKEGEYIYSFGFEESFGYNFSGNVSDKDGIAASLLFAHLASFWASKNSSVLERLDSLFAEYGLFQEFTINKTYQGSSGIAIMSGIMDRVRSTNLEQIANVKVLRIRDVLKGVEFAPNGDGKQNISLPKSNVLQYFLQDGSVISLRPSGTEPKIKAYIVATEDCGGNLERAKEKLGQKVERFRNFLFELLEG